MIRLAKKPIWVFASGATLGFGAGLFMAASHRVCDPSFYLSMPECGIGFFPDVGACKFMLEFANFSEVFWHGMTLRVQDLISRHLLYAVVKNSDFNAYLSDMSPILPDIRVPAKTVAVNVAPISRYYNEMLLGVAAKLGYQELAVYEYALARFMLMEPDFTEGISAFFDKRKPNWQISYKRQELIDMVRKIPDNILKAFYD